MPSGMTCKQCRGPQGMMDVSLEQDPAGNWACPLCGKIDEGVTDQVNFVSYSHVLGSIMDEDKRRQVREAYDRTQEKFQDGVRDILNLYLGIPSPKTAIIPSPGEGLRNGAKRWFERIRELEQKYYSRQTLVSNPNARRIKYLAAIAIKLAAQESAIIIQENRLEEAGIKRKRRDLPGYTKGDEKVLNPTLWDLFVRANSFAPDSFGHMDSYDYFRKLWRRYTHLVRFSLTPTESVLLHVDTVMTRLRMYAELSHEERVKVLISRPAISKGSERDWAPEDFAYFEGLNWNKVIPAAYQLFRMSEVVRLWGNQCTPMIAIALLLWAIQAVTGVVMPQYSSFQRELSAFYGKTPWGTAEKFRDMRNLLIAWSTSILDAGHSFPVLPLPSKGGFGDGINGFNADSRRPIPEIDIAVGAAPTLIAIWPQIVRARLRGRVDVMAYEDELWLARKMFVVSAGIYHYNQESLQKQLQPQVHLSRRRDGTSTQKEPKSTTTKTSRRAPRISFKYKIAADEARKAVQEYEPLKRAQVKSSFELYRQQQQKRQQSSSATNGTSLSSTGSSASSPGPSRPLQPRVQSAAKDFIPPPPEKTIEDMLARPDPSSDEASDSDSDEEVRTSKAPSTRVKINGANVRPQPNSQPFAFTIGPQGFNIDTQSEPRTDPAVSAAVNIHRNADSSSDLSPSPALIARRLSHDSLPGGGSASEAEAAIPTAQVHASLRRTAHTSSQGFSNSHHNTSSSLSRATATVFSAANASRATVSAPPRRAPSVSVEDDHVGLLIREREEYIQFRLPQFYESGYVVPAACEAEMWRWLREQVNNGSMPRHIDDAYLRSIGIFGDPRRMDLGDWVDSRVDTWSPVESLLRAGIRPQEIPTQHIPYSMIHLRLLLYHWNKYDLAPVGEAVTDDELDKEIEILFAGDEADQGDIWSQQIISQKEAKQRKERYIKSGAWNADGEKEVFEREKKYASSGKAKVVKDGKKGGEQAGSSDVPGADLGSGTEDDDEDDLLVEGGMEDNLDDEDYTPSRRATSASGGRANPSRPAKKGISKIQQTIRQSINNSRKQLDGLEGIIRVMQSGKENDGPAGKRTTANDAQLSSGGAVHQVSEHDNADTDVDVDVDDVDWGEGMIGALDFRDLGLVDEVANDDPDEGVDENDGETRTGRPSAKARATPIPRPKTAGRKRKNAAATATAGSISGQGQTSPRKPAKRARKGQGQGRGGASTFTGIASGSPSKSNVNGAAATAAATAGTGAGAETETASWAMLPPSLMGA
ncbi:hypothetical protein IAU59_004120 [Kwoniella sp. CBS 9459]